MFFFVVMFSKHAKLPILRWLRYLFIALSALGSFFSYFSREWDALGMGVIAILIFLVPLLNGKKKRMALPPIFQIIIFIFIFASMYLGEIFHFYYRYSWWDTIVHITSAPVMGYAGFMMVYTLNRDKEIHRKLSPFFIALFAFCFSTMIGVAWEIFEYAADAIAGANMQKARNLEELYGYFDTRLGVLDTMEDLIVNAIGAFVVSVVGYIHLKRKGGQNNVFWKAKDQFIDDNPEFFE